MKRDEFYNEFYRIRLRQVIYFIILFVVLTLHKIDSNLANEELKQLIKDSQIAKTMEPMEEPNNW